MTYVIQTRHSSTSLVVFLTKTAEVTNTFLLLMILIAMPFWKNHKKTAKQPPSLLLGRKPFNPSNKMALHLSSSLWTMNAPPYSNLPLNKTILCINLFPQITTEKMQLNEPSKRSNIISFRPGISPLWLSLVRMGSTSPTSSHHPESLTFILCQSQTLCIWLSAWCFWP